MSVSSGSDVTIPMNDSPPPPPSPYKNQTTDPQGSSNIANGIDNGGFTEPQVSSTDNETQKRSSSKDQTEIQMNDYTEPTDALKSEPQVTEAVNTELVHGMDVLDTIPHKPQSEFGPYEKFPEYFISVNQHKKLFSRGEKLSVTKDKRKGDGKWKTYLCWTLGGIILAAIVIISVLAAVGFFPERNPTYSMREMTTTPGQDLSTTEFPDSTESIQFSTSPVFNFSTTRDPEDILYDNYVRNAAKIEFTFQNGHYEDELGDPTSLQFKSLAREIENEVKLKLESESDVDSASARVTEFQSGSLIVKMLIGWIRSEIGEEAPSFDRIRQRVSSWNQVGPFTVRRGTFFDRLLNMCQLSNGDCSHDCEFGVTDLEFICSCPDNMVLSPDMKNCTSAPYVPLPETPEPEPSSEFPSPAPTLPEFSTSKIPVVQMTPEPTTTAQPSTTTTTTTAQPTPISHASVEQELTTQAPELEGTSQNENSESNESLPVEPIVEPVPTSTESNEASPVEPIVEPLPSSTESHEDTPVGPIVEPLPNSTESHEDTPVGSIVEPLPNSTESHEDSPVEPIVEPLPNSTESHEASPVEPIVEPLPTSTEKNASLPVEPILEPLPTSTESNESVPVVVEPSPTPNESKESSQAEPIVEALPTSTTTSTTEPPTAPPVSTSTTTSTTEAPPPITVASPDEAQGRAEGIEIESIPAETTITPMEILDMIPPLSSTHHPVTSVESGPSLSVESVDANPLINTTSPPQVRSEDINNQPSVEPLHDEDLGVKIFPEPSVELESVESMNVSPRKSSRAFDDSVEMSENGTKALINPSPSQSDEFMVFSDADMAMMNNNATTSEPNPYSSGEDGSVGDDSLGSAEVSHEFESLEHKRTEPLVENEAEVIPVSNNELEGNREVEEMTTPIMVSLINDTLVNDMIENATEDPSSEKLPEGSVSSSQEGSLEGVIIEANGNDEPSTEVFREEMTSSHPEVLIGTTTSPESIPILTETNNDSIESLVQEIIAETSTVSPVPDLPSSQTGSEENPISAELPAGNESGPIPEPDAEEVFQGSPESENELIGTIKRRK